MDVYFLKRLLRLKHDTNYETFLGTFAVRIFNIFTLVNDQTMHTLEMLFFRKGKKKCSFWNYTLYVLYFSIASLRTDDNASGIVFYISNLLFLSVFCHTPCQKKNKVANVSM